MNKNKRKLKLPSCKKVRLSLHLETLTIHPSSARQSPGSPKAWFYPMGCSQCSLSQLPQSQPMNVNSNSWENAGTNPNFWSCLQLWENVYRSPVVFTEHSWTNSWRIQFFTPTVIYLLHLDFWPCYSFPKLKCVLSSKISLMFKSKIGFL